MFVVKHGLAFFVFLHCRYRMKCLKLHKTVQDQLRKVWDGCHVSPYTDPSNGANFCRYVAWWPQPAQIRTIHLLLCQSPDPLMQLCISSHSLPVEQGRLARPASPRHVRWCTSCNTGTLRGIRSMLCLFALVLRMFAASLSHCLLMLMGPRSPSSR